LKVKPVTVGGHTLQTSASRVAKAFNMLWRYVDGFFGEKGIGTKMLSTQCFSLVFRKGYKILCNILYTEKIGPLSTTVRHTSTCKIIEKIGPLSTTVRLIRLRVR
jgi:hypothetical protein